ncbi:MAG: hypothetical protein EZS28_030129, partial [Streblomastix strix]
MIPPEKPDIITLLDDSGDIDYNYYSVRLINCKDLDDGATDPKNKNEMAIIDMIR